MQLSRCVPVEGAGFPSSLVQPVRPKEDEPHVEYSHPKTARDNADKISEIECNTDLPSRHGQQDGLQATLACESCISTPNGGPPKNLVHLEFCTFSIFKRPLRWCVQYPCIYPCRHLIHG